MPNHWHMVIWPRQEGELTDFVKWLTHTHVMRWHAHYGTSGTGHLYQGRYKGFPLETDEHFYTVMRYVERNALRANLVRRAEEWQWSSLWRRQSGNAESRQLLTDWPLPRPRDWVEIVNRPQSEGELKGDKNSNLNSDNITTMLEKMSSERSERSEKSEKSVKKVAWTAACDALLIGSCPHSWLFNQVAAVVHHGGAG